MIHFINSFIYGHRPVKTNYKTNVIRFNKRTKPDNIVDFKIDDKDNIVNNMSKLHKTNYPGHLETVKWAF